MEGKASDLRGMEDCGLWGRGRKGGRGKWESGEVGERWEERVRAERESWGVGEGR